MDFFYQSLAAAAGLSAVSAGMKIDLKVDLLLAHDGTGGKLIQAWKKSGRQKVFNEQKVLITLDHQFPTPTAGARTLHKQLQDFSAQQGITLYRHGEGVLHQVVAEQATPQPGWIIAGADGHVSTAGAFGAIAFSLKSEEMVPVLATGILEIVVPEVLSGGIHGSLPPGTDPHDLALTLTGLIGRSRARGKAVLISGEGIWGLSLDGKMAVCNRIGETGAIKGLIIPQEGTGEVRPGVGLCKHYRRHPAGFSAHGQTAALLEQVGGTDLMALLSSIIVCGFVVDLSPLSTTGAVFIANAPATADKTKLFRNMLIWELSMSVVGAVVCWLAFTVLGLP
jgi:homoaconitase/3-isopropylmalate dehydratase large subunit